ncbi:hypothetical protein A2706_00950 [Candidatus Peribacteria bacterium RIFCSPHIGHO2_01_FULL_51_35]|nr:MAG: hypothetical protein A2706_00950 [Candidatus Peribacteria bacterium RIFCSPHIGHO2_01_FULL_51_35]
MHRKLLLIVRCLLGLGALVPAVASAQSIFETVSSVGGFLPAFTTGANVCQGGVGCGFVNIIASFVANARPLVFIGAFFLIVVSGIRMIITEEEESFGKAKRIISASLTGVILSYLVEPIVNAFYGGLGSGTITAGIFGGIGIGSVPTSNVPLGASILYIQVMGLINWALVIVGTLTVFMIIVSGFKAMTKAGSEEGVSELRRTVFYVIGGVILIVFAETLNLTFGLFSEAPSLPGVPSVAPVAQAIVLIVNFVLSFAALVAVAIIIYCGFQMVLNFGNEEMFTKAKSLLIRVAIGLVLIGMSFAIVNFVIAAAIL